MKEKWKTFLLATAIISLCVALLLHPQHAFEAAVRGLHMWWEVVFPSLLPFFIVSEMLISFGVVHFIGVLLEPLMRPLFKVPGSGAFVWAMGMASGYPAGARLTARLYKQKQLSATEAERLVSFTNCSNPLFMFGAISVGFFHNPHIGIVLACSHYLGNVIVGFVMRFYGRDEQKTDMPKKRRLFREAWRAMHRERLTRDEPLGKMLGDAVRSSMQTLFMIGGFIILFSVLNKLLYVTGVTEQLATAVAAALAFVHFPRELSVPLIAGAFEMTLGSQMTSQVGEATLLQKVMMTSFILAFAGFSVQAQVASILAEANIRFRPFFLSRLLHGGLAAGLTYVLWRPLYSERVDRYDTLPVALMPRHIATSYWEWLERFGALVTTSACIIYVVWFMRRQRIKPPV